MNRYLFVLMGVLLVFTGCRKDVTDGLQPSPLMVTDIDGNTYNTVQIGNQFWTQSNLKVTKYRNGDNIPTGLSDAQWYSSTTGAYAIYNNAAANDALYGKLYNWYAATDSRGLCPTGWHVPTDAEWTALTDFLGGESVAGGKMKSTSTQPTPGGWNSPNTGATDSSGFTGLPDGYRDSGGGFYYLGSNGIWWSSSDAGSGYAWFRRLDSYYANVFRYNVDQRLGFSVRCLKNTLPQVNTTSVTKVSYSSALVTGEVSPDGGDQNTTRGFCYAITTNPAISNDTTMNGTGLGVYSDTLQNLVPLTTYYVRAYATNSLGTSYGNEMSFTTTSLTIGLNYAGGILFYIDSTSKHGLVCAPSDQGSFQWGCNGTNISTSTAFGTGMANTLAIVNGCSQRPIAASVCNDLVLNGYDDWYLPSRDELSLMYQNLGTLNLGNFSNTNYWSSSQFNSDYAWGVNFGLGNVGTNGKSSGSQVRAVRAF